MRIFGLSTHKLHRDGDKVSLLDCINTSSADASNYIPFELLDGSALGRRGLGQSVSTGEDGLTASKKRRDELLLQKLEKAEATGGSGQPEKRGEEEDDDIEGAMEGEEDEFELDDDYGVDHYASDDGGDYDDDGEAVF
jgi:hypothetical protein